MSTEWRHVADLATIQRGRLSEVRITVVQNRDGHALMMRRHVRSPHHAGHNALPDTIIIFPERITEMMMALEKGGRAISALREAERA